MKDQKYWFDLEFDLLESYDTGEYLYVDEYRHCFLTASSLEWESR